LQKNVLGHQNLYSKLTIQAINGFQHQSFTGYCTEMFKKKTAFNKPLQTLELSCEIHQPGTKKHSIFVMKNFKYQKTLQL
jgi:hypothetical protein